MQPYESIDPSLQKQCFFEVTFVVMIQSYTLAFQVQIFTQPTILKCRKGIWQTIPYIWIHLISAVLICDLIYVSIMLPLL